MSKTFKKFFAGLLAFVMVFAMTATAAPKAEVKADEEKFEMFLAIGAAEDWSMCYDNAPDIPEFSQPKADPTQVRPFSLHSHSNRFSIPQRTGTFR